MKKAGILLPTLDVQAANGSGNLQTWSPWVRFALQGPTPAGGQISVFFRRADGSAWFSLWSDVKEIGAEDEQRFDLWTAEDQYHSAEPGRFPFCIKLESEIDGVDETLFEGTLDVVRKGELFLACHDWLLSSGAIAFDIDDPDAPALGFSIWLPGGAEPERLSAYLFRDGQRLLSTDNGVQGFIETRRSVFFNDNTSAFCAGFAVSFPPAKAWRNLDYADMDDWQVLAETPGQYELKVALDRKPVRSMRFQVDGAGRLVPTGPVVADEGARWVMLAPVTVIAKGEADFPHSLREEAFYGNPGAAHDEGVERMYSEMKPPEAGSGNAANALYEDALEVIAEAEKLHRWYYEDMTRGSTSAGDPIEPEQCEMAIARVEECLHWVSKLVARIGAETEADFNGELQALQSIAGQLESIKNCAQGLLHGRVEKSEAELAPYRAKLKNDKLTIFEQHPAGEYRYYTSKKRVIETPEELARAERWYFLGQEDAGYITQRWIVRGWRFDVDHKILDEFEQSGHGVNPPLSAFQ